MLWIPLPTKWIIMEKFITSMIMWAAYKSILVSTDFFLKVRSVRDDPK
jgi:hypothetical protein